MNNKQISANFAKGARTGKGSNLFIDGDTVYSYGYHFPLATRTALTLEGLPVVLVNSRRYSNTTARHKRYVISALQSNYFILYLTGANLDNARRQREENTAEIEALTDKARRSRSDAVNARYRDSMNKLNWQNAALDSLQVTA
jgi:hypothetical protein